MMNMQLLNRSGLAAIAAATALISTPALAQEATPVTSDPAPIVADAPLPSAPATTPDAASDTLAPAATAPAATAPAATGTTNAPATRTARPARVATPPAARAPATAAPRSAAPVAAAPLANGTTDTVLPPVDPAMVAPLPEPLAATPAVPASEGLIDDDMLPIAGAAGLGILALAGAGFAMRRRRRNDDEAMVEDDTPEPVMTRPAPLGARPVAATAPVTATAPMGSSAFSWNSNPSEPAKPVDRIEAAKRGPTPDNPSLSLKKRLKRAAFFDQRDRQIAAGMGTPVSATAGLPDGMISDTPTHSASPRRADQDQSKDFGKIVQPA